eukprot:gene5487-9203_t
MLLLLTTAALGRGRAVARRRRRAAWAARPAERSPERRPLGEANRRARRARRAAAFWGQRDFDATRGFPGEGPTKKWAPGEFYKNYGEGQRKWTEQRRQRDREEASRTRGPEVVAHVQVHVHHHRLCDLLGRRNCTGGTGASRASFTVAPDAPLVRALLPGAEVLEARVPTSGPGTLGGTDNRLLYMKVKGLSEQRAALSLQVEAALGPGTAVAVTRGRTRPAIPQKECYIGVAKGKARAVQRQLERCAAVLVEIDGGLVDTGRGVLVPAVRQLERDERNKDVARRKEERGGAPETRHTRARRKAEKARAAAATAKPPPGKPASVLRIVHLNCRSMQSHIVQIRRLLAAHQVDVLCLQESMLGDGDDLPRVQGYAALRRDRPTGANPPAKNGAKGGLVTLVRDGLPWCEESTEGYLDPKDKTTELQHLRLYPLGSKPLRVLHVYSPPLSVRDLKPGALRTDDDTIVLGDFNRHAPEWDPHAAASFDRNHSGPGKQVVDWARERRLAILTDGVSAPDLTLCSRDWAERCTWATLDQVVSASDGHLPVETDKYTAAMELTMETLAGGYRALPTGRKAGALTSAILHEARSCIPRGCGRPAPKAWWSDEVEELQAAALKEAARAARAGIRDAKREAFQDFVSSVDRDTDPAKIWGVIRGMDGRTPTTRSIPALRVKGR